MKHFKAEMFYKPERTVNYMDSPDHYRMIAQVLPDNPDELMILNTFNPPVNSPEAYRWCGFDLNREAAQELVEILQHWLATGKVIEGETHE